MGLHHVAKGVPLILRLHDFCNNCQLGQQAHEPISKQVIHPRITKPLVLIHFDICGEIYLAYLGENILSHSLMIIPSSLGFILCEINLKLCNIFNISRLMLNWLSTPRFKSFGVIGLGNFFFGFH